jgi:hypothetical protein
MVRDRQDLYFSIHLPVKNVRVKDSQHRPADIRRLCNSRLPGMRANVPHREDKFRVIAQTQTRLVCSSAASG